MNKQPNLIFSIFVTMGIASCLFPAPSFGQATLLNPTGTVNPADTFKTDQNNNPFSSSSDASSGVFDIIHRAQLGNIRDMNEFNSEQTKNLDGSTDQFRRLQLERLQKLNQANQAQQTNPKTLDMTTPKRN